MPTALALSPHLDDAAFSCGGTLATLAAKGWRVVMATVFTATVPDPQGFALACQLDKGLPASADYMALRRAEDHEAAHLLGVEVRHLPFREAPHRGYGSAPELFGAIHAGDDIAGALRDALHDLVAETAPDLIPAPQAIGGHVDHVQMVLSLREAVHDVPVLWWRDFPYTVRDAAPKQPLRDLFESLPTRQVTLDGAAEAAKAAACGAYATQIGFQFGGAEGLARRLAEEGGVERFKAEGVLPAGLALP